LAKPKSAGEGDSPLSIPIPLDAFGLSIWAPLAFRLSPLASHPLPQIQMPGYSIHATHPLSTNSGYATSPLSAFGL